MSFVSGLFGGNKAASSPPSPQPAPPPPTRVDADAAARAEAAKIRRGQGQGSTILTSGQGLVDPLNQGGKKTLGA